MHYEELDSTTRRFMLDEFGREVAGGLPYRSRRLTDAGWAAWQPAMREAINEGNEVTLAGSMNKALFWKAAKSPASCAGYARTLALTEFSTWYVRGLSARLLKEGVEQCEVYRGEEALVRRCECTEWEGRTFDTRVIYNGHRARYHGPAKNRRTISVPSGVNCHHAIRRVSQENGA